VDDTYAPPNASVRRSASAGDENPLAGFWEDADDSSSSAALNRKGPISDPAMMGAGAQDDWECKLCTYRNEGHRTFCEMCTTSKWGGGEA
jgi:hypothetical protein